MKTKGHRNAAKTDNVIRSISSASLVELVSIWRARETKQWSQSPDRYRLVAEKMLQQGEPLLAFDVVTEGLSILPDDVRLRQLQGLALARSGATERANAILESLRRDGQTDEETLGMLGRLTKISPLMPRRSSSAKNFCGAQPRPTRKLINQVAVTGRDQCRDHEFAHRRNETRL